MRPSTLTSIALTALALTTSVPARAAEPSPGPTPTPTTTAPTPDTSVTYAKRTVIDFTSITITGELVRPDASYVTVPRRARFRSLIRTRGDFRSELDASADRL